MAAVWIQAAQAGRNSPTKERSPRGGPIYHLGDVTNRERSLYPADQQAGKIEVMRDILGALDEKE